MAGIFKSYRRPIDGVVITDANCIYKCNTGSDSNDGTRANPVATMSKALTLLTSAKTTICFRGETIENILFSNTVNNSTFMIFGDDDSAVIKGDFTTVATYTNMAYYLVNFTISGKLTLNGGGVSGMDRYILNMNINSIIPTSISGDIKFIIERCFITNYSLNVSTFSSVNNTIINYKNYIQTGWNQGSYEKQSAIYVGTLDLYPYQSVYTVVPIFSYSIIRKSLQWRWGGVNVPITYTAATGNISTDSAQWKVDVFNGLTAYYNTLSSSSAKTYLALLLSNWSTIFPSTTMIVDDINCCPIFNKYVDGSPVDYSLKISDTNPALTMSSVSSYVGAYLASITPVYDNTTLKELDSNGAETANTPDILLVGSQGNIYPSPSATQYRNRIKTNVLTYPRGYSFSNGVQSMLTSGLSARYQYGKRQTYTTVYTPQESIHVEAFDTPTIRSSFPMFSAKLNGATQIWYHTNGAGTVAITTGGVITGTGTAFTTNFVVGQMIYVGNEGHAITAINSATSMNVASWSVAVAAGSSYASVPTNKLNTQVLFSDLSTYYNISSDLNMTEYGAWAVSNADYETYLLSSKTGVTLRTPFLKYLKFWIEINYYD